DNEVEVSVRGDLVAIRTISGRDARDDGSECNAPLPDRDIVGFNFQVVDSRNEIRLLAEPSRRNGFAAIVRIRDSPGGGNDRPSSRRDDNFDRPSAAPGFSWNNTMSFRGNGSGTAIMNDSGEMRLGEVAIEIDRGGKLAASFRTAGRGRPISFTGQILASEGGRWKADVMSEDRRLRGPMWISVDDRRQVNSITLEATDGRDRMRLNWDRREECGNRVKVFGCITIHQFLRAPRRFLRGTSSQHRSVAFQAAMPPFVGAFFLRAAALFPLACQPAGGRPCR